MYHSHLRTCWHLPLRSTPSESFGDNPLIPPMEPGDCSKPSARRPALGENAPAIGPVAQPECNLESRIAWCGTLMSFTDLGHRECGSKHMVHLPLKQLATRLNALSARLPLARTALIRRRHGGQTRPKMGTDETQIFHGENENTTDINFD